MLLFYSYFNLFTCIYSFLLVLLTIQFSSYPKIKWHFVLFLTGVALWSFGIFNHSLSQNINQAIFWDRFLHVFAILTPLFFLNFIAKFTNNSFIIKFFAFNYLLAFIQIYFLINTSLFIKTERAISVFQYFPLAGSLYTTYLIYYILCLFLSYLLLLDKYKTGDITDKKRIKSIFFATIIGWIGATTTVLPVYSINIFPYGNFVTFIYCGILFYAILKHELMDIRLAITKTFSYIISLSLLCISFIFPLLFINNKLFLFATVLVLSVFWAFNFLPFSNLLITTTKRKFIKGYYEPSKVLLTISDMLVSKTNREEILQNVLTILDDALELEQSTFIIAVRDKEDKLQGYKILDNEDIELAEISNNNPLIKYFKNNQSIHRSEDLEDELRTILAELNYTKNSLVFPLHSPELLEGILLLGKRSSEKAYKNDDIDFLKQLRAILTSAFYKLTPYEKIENNFLSTQKQLYDAERNLARTERIASLAHLIQEYNHEIKTPLAVLVGLLDSSDLPEDKKKKAYAQTSRIGDIVRTTLRLSSTKEGEVSSLNINEIIEQALYILPLSGVTVNKQLTTVPNIEGQDEDLQILVTNLLQNAKEAMPNGGTITIKTTSNEEHITLTIADTGCGIPEELREKVFEPFFSTHVTKGRGLGLPIVFRIVREHLGTLELKSETGKGTTFLIKLPLSS